MKNLDNREQELYNKKRKVSTRKRSGIKSEKKQSGGRAWNDDPITLPKKKTRSVTRTILGFSVAFFAFSVVFLAFQFLSGNGKVSPTNVDIEVLGNTFAAGGEELPLQIQITNRNSVSLLYSDLIIKYPDGAGDKTTERISLGTIKPRETIVETKDITLFGRQGDLQEILVDVEFRTEGSNAIFHRDFSHFVTLNSAPLDLLVEAPSSVVSGQQATYRMTIRANSDVVNQDLGVKVDYPIGFRYEDSNMDPAYGENVWYIGDLAAGSEKEITFTGALFGESGEERSFRFFVGPYGNGTSGDLKEVYSSYIHTESIVRPFIATQVLVDGIDDEVVAIKAQETVPISIKWSNNLPTRVDNVVVTVDIEGDILNESSVQNTGGFYDSNANRITWDKSNYGNFASVQPGARDTLTFRMSSLPLYQNGSLAQDAEITLRVSIRGQKPTEGGSLENVQNTLEKTIQINSDFAVAADGYFRSGPFNNQGTIPPVAGQETEYTIIWSVTNSANPVSNGKVTTTLPNYVVYKNQVNPASESLSFDPNTRELTWNLGTVTRGAGLTSARPEVAFLLGFTPSISQVGSAPLLTGEIELTGRDLFTGETLSSSDSAVSIRLTNDTGYNSSEGRVIAP